MRHLGAIMAAASALVAAPAPAQQWSVYSGAGGRIEYNDNYFFVAPGRPATGNPGATADKESAFTLSLSPFVAASRRTEVSEVTALVAIGANKVWGISPSEEYLSGRFELNGTLREELSTWSGRVSYSRSSGLEEAIRDAEVVRVRTFTDAALVEGSYNYLITDRWTIGATLGGYSNWHDSVQVGDTINDDLGYNASGNLGYLYSDQTRLNYKLGYTYYASDITRSNVLTTTAGIVHRYSPQLTVSGSVGVYWSDTIAKQNLPGQGVPITAGEGRDDTGTFLGGSIEYALSESTQFAVRALQGLAPSGTGTITENTEASVMLWHSFSDRLTGRLAADYTRKTYPVALDSSASDNTLEAGAGVTYRLAERWKVDAGYQYIRTRYGQSSGEASSNVVFLSIAYNWPGASFTDWVGNPVDTQGLPGAGPLALPDRTGGATSLPSATIPSESLPFDGLTLP